jgi:hypothetical protein
MSDTERGQRHSYDATTSIPPRQTDGYAQGASSYCISKPPAVMNHLQPLSEGDPETGTPPTGSRRLDIFSHRARHGCSDDEGPRTGTASETERKHEQPEAARLERERP